MTKTMDITSAPLAGTVIDRPETSTAHLPGRGTSSSITLYIPAADDATLSEIGSQLATVASPASDVRADKVAALKSAIDAGSYHVASADVADKLIGSMLG
jgi:flagellar biosynthesis anti-sigma factor FlgM